MEHAKKFALVPLSRMHQFEEEHLSDLDNQIQIILKHKNLDDNEKAKLYTQVVQKYVTFPNNNFMKNPEENKPVQVLENTEVHPVKNNIENKILESAPIKQKMTAKRIISFLKEHNILWNEKKRTYFK